MKRAVKKAGKKPRKLGAYEVQVQKGRDGWRIRIRAPNGQVPGQERYANKGNAVRAAQNLCTAAGSGRFRVQVL